MQLYTVPQILSIADAIAIAYDTQAAALDAGKTKIDTLLSRYQTAGDAENVYKLYPTIASIISSAPAQGWFGGQFRMHLRQVENLIRATGKTVHASIVDFDSFATYYNNPENPGGAAYSCLYPWEFALVHYYALGRQLSPGNVYCPGGVVYEAGSPYQYTTAQGVVVSETRGWKLAHGSITGGASNFVADNSGEVPETNSLSPYTQGYAPVQVELVVGATAFAGDPSTLLRFTIVDQDGDPGTWDVEVVNAGGVGLASGAVAAVPTTPTTDRLRSVSAVAIVGTLTDGDWSLRVKQPAGRPA